jgi:hypothetical protein
MLKLKKTIPALLFPVAFGLTILSPSCREVEKNGTAGSAKIKFINAAQGTGSVLFKVDGEAALSKLLPFSGSEDYIDVEAGSHEFSVFSDDTPDPILSESVNIQGATENSVYLASSEGKKQFVVLNDDLSAPSQGMAKIRFVNMSEKLAKADVFINGKAQAVFSEVGFKKATAFINISPGEKINFQIRESGKEKTLVNLSNVQVSSGEVYTLWSKGEKPEESGDLILALGIIVNKKAVDGPAKTSR